MQSATRAGVKARNLAHIRRDRGYRHIERDEALENVCRLITDSGLELKEIVRRCDNRVSKSTLQRWMDGTTRRPQNYTINWVIHALGYERLIVSRSEAMMIGEYRRSARH